MIMKSHYCFSQGENEVIPKFDGNLSNNYYSKLFNLFNNHQESVIARKNWIHISEPWTNYESLSITLPSHAGSQDHKQKGKPKIKQQRETNLKRKENQN